MDCPVTVGLHVLMGLLTPQVAVCHVLKCADTVAAAAAAAFMA